MKFRPRGLPAIVSRLRAFTLVELLVVMAIVAVLVGIIFPVFNKIRDQALRNTCLNNLKQIGAGLYAYAQDNNGFLPILISRPTKWDAPIGTMAGWMQAAMRALNVTNSAVGFKMIVCPGSKEPYMANFEAFRDPMVPEPRQQMLRNIASPLVYLAYDPILQVEQRKPARIADVNCNQADWNRTNSWMYARGGPHDAGYNLLFSDGHVEHLARYTSTAAGKVGVVVNIRRR